MRWRLCTVLAVAMIFCGSPALADTTHVIICGSGGEPAFVAAFDDWGHRLAQYLKNTSPSTHKVFLLTEDGSRTGRKSDLEGIRSVFTEVAGATTQDHVLFVYLIGHGSHRAGVSKFNIPGPDLSVEELAELLDTVPVSKAAIVVGTSSSAGFVNGLSRGDRMICAATRSVDERNATRFMGHFVDGLETGTADMNRDERVSLLEACSQAAVLTAASFTTEGLIATEHAILDDNGDGLGTRLPLAQDNVKESTAAIDGASAETCYIKDLHYPEHVPADLVLAYRTAIDKVESLKKAKSTLDEAEYYARLEALLLEVARTNRAIHEASLRLGPVQSSDP